MPSLTDLNNSNAFIRRHIGVSGDAVEQMLNVLGLSSLDALLADVVPAEIQLKGMLGLPEAVSEATALDMLNTIAQKNVVGKSYIGLGYHDTFLPAVIQRNVLENPSWYTAYTPYQPEIAQGRLELLLNFQQMIMDLTAMELANASLLDEATAAAEAMAMAMRLTRKKDCHAFFVEADVLPQTQDVLKTRAQYFGIEIIVDSAENLDQYQVIGALFQYPGSRGLVRDLKPLIKTLHAQDALAIVAADLLSLCVLKAPGEMGADIVVGNSQRFGVPMGFGGPHAAFIAIRNEYRRLLPGRLIGVSKDARGQAALRMALQTREQHIRREKATSNICTAQVLLANLAVLYAIYHGPKGLQRIAMRAHRLAAIFAVGLQQAGMTLNECSFFETVTVTPGDAHSAIVARAEAAHVNLRIDPEGSLGVSMNETTTAEDIEQLWTIFLGEHRLAVSDIDAQLQVHNPFLSTSMKRESAYLQHPVFNQHHSETQLMRYLKKLESRDLALNHSLIPLGSCTMKLNAAVQMMPVSWPEFARLHPFAPESQSKGYQQLFAQLDAMLTEITGFAAMSLQPNSGAQGEYAGLLAIRHYQASIGESHRDVCLIPRSAHGTNPASAQMAGLTVRVVETDNEGNIDFKDLTEKVASIGRSLSCLMITYPSTHGVYEPGISQICELIHKNGGQVYMDGANMNAQVGLVKPADIGVDVAHLNLHKTFAIPHGGGGPGMGPIGVKAHLVPFLPNHRVTPIQQGHPMMGAVSASAYGSASILPISWMYITLLGHNGLRRSTLMAILNANYMAERLKNYYPILYTGLNGRVAHECILDLRPIKAQSGISEVDIAKRLIDFGFHAPTMSFPVSGTFMIEPTESESKQELDRFIEAMIMIHQEIENVKSGVWPRNDNPLINAPHTQQDLVEEWSHPYDRVTAVFPLPWVSQAKFWPSVKRLDDVWGDRHLVCSCPSIDQYEETESGDDFNDIGGR